VGRKRDLEKIANIILKEIRQMNPGDKFSIDKEYNNENEAKILTNV
jgi:hypothetical protein